MDGVRESAGECLDRGLRPGCARSLGAPPLGERGERVRSPGPQVLARQAGHQSVADVRHEMGVVRLDDPRDPRAEVGPQVGHVVPEMGADGGVVVQLGEPHTTARSGAGSDLRQPLGEVLALEEGRLLLWGPYGAQQERGRLVDDVGVCAVEHGDGDHQGALRGLEQTGHAVGDFDATPGARTLRGRTPCAEFFAWTGRFAGAAYAVGEIADLPHGSAFAQELIDGDVVAEELFVRHAMGAQMASEDLQRKGRRRDLDPVVLEVGFEDAVVRHDDDEVGPPLVHRPAQGGQVALCREPRTGLRAGQVEQQPVAGVH